MIELAAAVVLLAAGAWLYRRRDKADSYCSQGAVILFVVAAIMGAPSLGALDYHPSRGELESLKARGQ